jgi:hypothetical protein
LTASDTVVSSISGASGAITIQAGAGNHLALSGVPNAITAGTPFVFTVTAEDPFNNTAFGYGGTIHFTSSDPQAVLPVAAMLTSGVGTFTATLKTSGNQSLTGSTTPTNVVVNGDFESGNVGFTTGYVFNQAAPGGYLLTTNPQLIQSVAASYGDHTTGSGLMMMNDGATQANVVLWSETLAVSANAQYGFSIWVSSWQAGSPAVLTFLFNGVALGTFTAPGPSGVWQQYSATWNSSGTSTLTLTIIDLNTAFSFNDFAIDDISLQGPSAPSGTGTATVKVASATVAHLALNAPTVISSGIPVPVTVVAQDSFNNTAPNYAGTVQFGSTDTGAVFPGNSTLSNGVGIFSATLNTLGNQTMAVMDTHGSIPGASNLIAVNAPVATHFLLTAPTAATAGGAFSFTVT